jgi:hypothetical protein
MNWVQQFRLLAMGFSTSRASPSHQTKQILPLIVDPNVLCWPGTVRLERFEMAARKNSKILETPGRMEVEKLAARYAFDSWQC